MALSLRNRGTQDEVIMDINTTPLIDVMLVLLVIMQKLYLILILLWLQIELIEYMLLDIDFGLLLEIFLINLLI